MGRSAKAEARSSRTSVGIRAPSPLPNPLRRATAYLLGQLAVGNGAARRGVEHNNRLSKRGGLGEPNRAGDDVPAHLVSEVGPHLGRHLVGQLGAGVEHGEDNGADLKL